MVTAVPVRLACPAGVALTQGAEYRTCALRADAEGWWSSAEERIARSGVPYTLIRTAGPLVDAPGANKLSLAPVTAQAATGQLSRNEVAQLCVQAALSAAPKGGRIAVVAAGGSSNGSVADQLAAIREI